MMYLEEKVAIVTAILTVMVAAISAVLPEYAAFRYTIFLGVGIIMWMWWRAAWITPGGKRV